MSTSRLTLNILVVIGVLAFLAAIRAGIEPDQARQVSSGAKPETAPPEGDGRSLDVAAHVEPEWHQPQGVSGNAPAIFLGLGSDTDVSFEHLDGQLRKALTEGAALVIDGERLDHPIDQLAKRLPAAKNGHLGGVKLIYIGDEDVYRKLLALGQSRNIEVQWVPNAEG